MVETLTIGEQFAGPPGVGNGGYISGLLARVWDEPVQVTLRRPTPLGQSLAIVTEAGGRQLQDGEVILAEARPAGLALAVPEPPDYETAAGTRRYYLEHAADHPFPNCFVCGPLRTQGDGLRIFPAPVPGRNLVAAVWRPNRALAEGQNTVRPEYIWAALDCPGGIAAYSAQPAQSPASMWGPLTKAGDDTEKQMRPLLLGQMTASVEPAIVPDEEYVVIGWQIERAGRKHYVGTALFDATGRPRAQALSLWIEPAPR